MIQKKSWPFPVANLVVKKPLPERPYQKESSISYAGI